MQLTIVLKRSNKNLMMLGLLEFVKNNELPIIFIIVVFNK